MRLTMDFLNGKHNLLFDLGLVIIFKEISGVDLIAEGDKRDNVKIAQTIFVCAYKRACQDDETVEEFTIPQLEKAFLRFNLPDMNLIMSAFTTIINLEADPDKKTVDPVTSTDNVDNKKK